jgi:L-lactate utilization protein LutB
VVFQIKEFASFQEIEEALDREISNTKSRLGKSLQRLDEIRSLAEKTKRIRQVVSRLAGKKAVEESSSEVSVDGFSVVLDANPLDELTALETVVRSHQEFLMSLQKTRESLNALEELGDTEGMTFLVVENRGVPEKILLKIA